MSATGLRQDQMQHCACCHKGVMHDGNIMFYRLTMQRLIVNLPAIKKQHGLEQMMGGDAASRIAFHMGSQEDMAKYIDDALAILICDTCAMEHQLVAGLYETATQAAEAQAEAKAKINARAQDAQQEMDHE